jgi:endonuclease YncB( thermonuclease family)
VLPGGSDLGRLMIRSGHAKVYVFNRPFLRVRAYRAAQAGARLDRAGMWGGCAGPGGGAPQRAELAVRVHQLGEKVSERIIAGHKRIASFS